MTVGKHPRPGEEFVRLLRERHDALLPVLRVVAESYGYALAVHGSLQRDIDLIAVPWRDEPIEPEPLVEALHKVCNAVYGCTLSAPTDKPQGRRAWVILFPGFEAMYIDLSVFPPVEKKEPPAPLNWERTRGCAVVSGSHNHCDKPIGKNARVWSSEASRTPPAFADALIQLAANCGGAP